MVTSVSALETGAPFTGLRGPHESRQPGISFRSTPFAQPRQGRPGPLCLCAKPLKQKKTSVKEELHPMTTFRPSYSEVTALSQQVTDSFIPQTF